MASHIEYLKLALRLARRAYGLASPNPMVGAVLVKAGKIIGQGWHHQAGQPHAEIEALRDAQRRGNSPQGATLYVTLEPCSTCGRTPPCTDAVIAAGIKTVICGATDPNPLHGGRGFKMLQRAGIKVRHGLLAAECAALNEAFNHWIVHRTPLVTVKAAMTLDGKIATASGQSKWITGEKARAEGMRLREGADAILVGIQTVLADDPSLTFRPGKMRSAARTHKLRRLVLDSHARTPLTARIVNDAHAALTTIIVGEDAPAKRVAALSKKATVWKVPLRNGRIHLPWLLKKLGAENVISLLVEGGGEVNASFLLGGLAHRVAFFYAPKILGGRDSKRAVGGEGATGWNDILELTGVTWKKLGSDLMLSARIADNKRSAQARSRT